jgi:hypothetical protein
MTDQKIAHKRLNGILLFLLCFFVFSLTLSSRFYGYEKAGLRTLRNMLYLGDFTSYTPSGLMDILSYLPMEWVNWIFVNPGEFLLRDFICLFTLPLMTALICVFFYLAVLELFQSVETALQTTLLFAFTTMIWPYSKMGMELQHTLWSTASLWMLILWKKRGGRLYLVLFGICAGLVLQTKVYGFVMTGAMCLYVLGDIFIGSKWKKDSLRSLVSFFLPVLCSLFLLAIMNKVRFGSPFLGTRYNVGYEAKRIPVWQGLFGFLFSSGKSIFIYNPLLIVSVFFIPRFLRRFGYLKLLLILVFGIGLVFHSLLWIWTDETWGPRKLHYLIPFAFLPLGILMEEFRRHSFLKRLAVILIILLGIFVQILGVSFSYEAQPVMLQWYEMSSLENLRYNPRLSHTAINYALLESTIDKYLKGETHYIIYQPTFFITVRPVHPVKPVAISMKIFSNFDFWFLDNRPPRGGRFFLCPFARFYFSLLLLLVPLLFFLLYLLNGRIKNEKYSWKKCASGWVLLILSLSGPILCLVYNRTYARDSKIFLDGIPESNHIVIGNDPVDETVLGHGWRNSEWMKDPKNLQFKIPFRWTTADKSSLFLPVKPHAPYDLTFKIVFVYPTRISAFVNGYRVGCFKGQKNEDKTVTLRIPESAIGYSPVCEVEIQHHELHIPAREDPEHSKDTSTLGVMVYDLAWKEAIIE